MQLSALSPPPTIATSQALSSGSAANSSRLLSQWKTRPAASGSWGKARWMPGPVRTSAPPVAACARRPPRSSTAQPPPSSSVTWATRPSIRSIPSTARESTQVRYSP